MNQSLIEARAQNLCIMYLTRSPKILFARNNKDLFSKGHALVDLEFDINNDNFYKGFVFGVVLKATQNGYSTLEKMFTDFKTGHFEPNNQQISRKVMPVLLIGFDMTNDKGYFSWISSPANNQLTIVKKITAAHIKGLNTRAVDEIASIVERYYTAQ